LIVTKPLIVGVSGSVTRPSRTTSLVRSIVQRVAARGDYATQTIELVDAAPILFASLTRPQLTAEARAIVETVENADLLVIGTPVYRASMTGALKHLFDLVHHQYFTSKPVVLAATGGTALHGLVTEHQLRPLFGFLNALTLPTTLYAIEADFEDHRLVSAKVAERIERAADEAAFALESRRHTRPADIHPLRATA
jgi:FMN reductase